MKPVSFDEFCTNGWQVLLGLRKKKLNELQINL